jgi:uncharacterized protein YndB with AHSA1/START domain
MATKSNEAAIAGKTKTVSITRMFDLPLDKIWKAWTEVNSFKKWWGPKDFTCPSCTIDLKPGGKNIACMKSTDGKEYWSTCIYKEITPKKKIVYEDNFADSKGNIVPPSYYDMPGEWSDVIVTVTMEEAGGKTKMTMQQTNIPEVVYDECIKGWQESLDKIEKNLK